MLQTRLGPALAALTGQLEKSARPIAEDPPFGSQVNKEPSPDFDQLNTQIEEARSELLNNKLNGKQ